MPKKPVSSDKLRNFSGKIGSKAEWSRGVLISVSGFETSGLDAFGTGKSTNIICIDGLDLCTILERKIDLRCVLKKKIRLAAEENRAYVPVREFIDAY